MKKFYLFAAAMMAAMTINANEIAIDLSTASVLEGASKNMVNNELVVSYNLGEWGAAGVEFALPNLDVTNIEFEYKGDESVTEWVSFLVYLVDSRDGMWYSNAADLSISSWNNEWENKSYMPSDVLWGSSTAVEPVKPFKKLAFIANPEHPTQGEFAIRNVKVTVPDSEEALDNIHASNKAVKVICDGQVLILRDGKTFNALGAEMK